MAEYKKDKKKAGMMPVSNIQNQNEEARRIMEQMAEVDRINEQTKLMEQEKINLEHDLNFSRDNGSDQTMYAVIGTEEIRKAFNILLKYKEKKEGITAKIINNEKFWKLNHWDVLESGKEDDHRIKPKSGWLFNTIINKHADAMDNYPEANILPRAKDDEEVADALSSIIPVILEQNDYENVYSQAQWYRLKNGASVQGVFWNNEKNNGLGDIEVKKVDILNLYWKNGICDIQDSPHLFHVVMMSNDEIREIYPEINVGGENILGLVGEQLYDNKEDTSESTPVIDWYYKKRITEIDDIGIKRTRTVLHYCKFCNEQVIYASENDPNYANTGWYEHGLYPFVVDTLFPVEDSFVGISYIDVIKDDQLYIDKLQQAILENAVVNARPRKFIKNGSGLNEEEYLDISKPIVHYDGNFDSAVHDIQSNPLGPIYQSVYLNKVQEMKETSGNTASSQGQASSVTSASGIASLQEAAGKLSRDSNKASYRAYKEVVNLVIELIRQFYNESRCFRITGDLGNNEFVQFDNSGLLPQDQGDAFDVALGKRMPIMDIDVRPQKKSAYSKEAQNQTALNLYGAGFFAPANADAANACLNMMEFDGIEKVKEYVRNNGMLYQIVQQQQAQLMAYQQQLMQLGVIVDASHGTNIAGQIANESKSTEMRARAAGQSGAQQKRSNMKESNGSLSTQAASATRGSTAPR